MDTHWGPRAGPEDSSYRVVAISVYGRRDLQLYQELESAVRFRFLPTSRPIRGAPLSRVPAARAQSRGSRIMGDNDVEVDNVRSGQRGD